jgi:hypothetical protein
MWQQPNSEAMKLLAETIAYETQKCIYNMYERINDFVVAQIEANKWVLTGTADAGTYFTTYTGDAKNVALAQRADAIGRLKIEMRQNNFDKFGGVSMLSSTTFEDIVNTYLELGTNNASNISQFLTGNTASGMTQSQAYFKSYVEESLENGAGNDAISYLIADGSMAVYQRYPKSVFDIMPEAQNGIANDYWLAPIKVGVGTSLFPDLPPFTIGVKGYKGWVDNSATGDTNNVDGATNDLGFSFVFTIQPGFLAAQDLANGNISSIIKVLWKTA